MSSPTPPAPPAPPSPKPTPIARLLATARWQLNRYRHRSILFFSLHKCATSLFNEYLFKQLRYQRQVDYASMVYHQSKVPRITFSPHGYVYGVLRLSVIPGSLVHEHVIKHLATEEFVRDKRSIFLIRDPRDVLISQYYSYGFVHSYSPNPHIRAEQQRQRARIRAQSLDQYVVEAAPALQGYFQHLIRLTVACTDGELFTYEELVEDFDQFMGRFERSFAIDAAVRAEVFARSRPRETEDVTRHRRSGKIAAYREKLQPETVARLNEILEPTLRHFGYQIDG